MAFPGLHNATMVMTLSGLVLVVSVVGSGALNYDYDLPKVDGFIRDLDITKQALQLLDVDELGPRYRVEFLSGPEGDYDYNVTLSWDMWSMTFEIGGCNKSLTHDSQREDITDFIVYYEPTIGIIISSYYY